jgi:hypothetical protein
MAAQQHRKRLVAALGHLAHELLVGLVRLAHNPAPWASCILFAQGEQDVERIFLAGEKKLARRASQESESLAGASG